MFENSEFGDKYVTRDGKIALYIGKISIDSIEYVQLYVDGIGVINYDLSGKVYESYEILLDIVSKYTEPIDEITLRDRAWEWTSFVKETSPLIKTIALESAMIGYRKAKEGE